MIALERAQDAKGDSHLKHMAGGYFVNTCPRCQKFIAQYESERKWSNKPAGHTMTRNDDNPAFIANGPGPYDAGYLDRRFRSASLKKAAMSR